jgi:ubiquinone/menaquinone biosynthesis C-methylase UbiE
MKIGRADHEIQLGKFLAGQDTQLVWGWGTPAGRKRAARRASLIETGAGLGPDVLALEIGCGTGMFTEIFASTGTRLVAVDISADLLKKAKSRNLPKDKVRL